MKHIVALLGVTFALVLPVQAMLELPSEIQEKIGSYLDTVSILSMPQVCSETKRVWDNFPSRILEERGITLREAFGKKNAHILERYIKDGNYQELIDDVSLARAIMLWAVHNDHRAIIDGLRKDVQVVDAMSRQTAREILVWVLLYEYRDFYTDLAKIGSKIDPQSEFVNKGLVLAVKHRVPSMVHTFIHTPCYTQVLKEKSINEALLIATQRGYYKIIKILLSNQRVLRLLTQNDLREAIDVACENNDAKIVKFFLNNRYVVKCLSVSWLRKMSNTFCDDWICNLLERCRQNKRRGV